MNARQVTEELAGFLKLLEPGPMFPIPVLMELNKRRPDLLRDLAFVGVDFNLADEEMMDLAEKAGTLRDVESGFVVRGHKEKGARRGNGREMSGEIKFPNRHVHGRRVEGKLLFSGVSAGKVELFCANLQQSRLFAERTDGELALKQGPKVEYDAAV